MYMCVKCVYELRADKMQLERQEEKIENVALLHFFFRERILFS